MNLLKFDRCWRELNASITSSVKIDDHLVTSHLHKKHGARGKLKWLVGISVGEPLAIGHATCFASGRGESFLSLETSVPDSPGFNCKHELAGCVHSSLPRFTSLPGINNRAASLKQPPGTSASTFSFFSFFFFFSSPVNDKLLRYWISNVI